MLIFLFILRKQLTIFTDLYYSKEIVFCQVCTEKEVPCLAPPFGGARFGATCSRLRLNHADRDRLRIDDDAVHDDHRGTTNEHLRGTGRADRRHLSGDERLIGQRLDDRQAVLREQVDVVRRCRRHRHPPARSEDQRGDLGGLSGGDRIEFRGRPGIAGRTHRVGHAFSAGHILREPDEVDRREVHVVDVKPAGERTSRRRIGRAVVGHEIHHDVVAQATPELEVVVLVELRRDPGLRVDAVEPKPEQTRRTEDLLDHVGTPDAEVALPPVRLLIVARLDPAEAEPVPPIHLPDRIGLGADGDGAGDPPVVLARLRRREADAEGHAERDDDSDEHLGNERMDPHSSGPPGKWLFR